MRKCLFALALCAGLDAFAGWTTEKFSGKTCLTDGNWKFVYEVVDGQDVRISSLFAGDGGLDLSAIETDTGLRVVEVRTLWYLDDALAAAAGVSSGYARTHIRAFTGNAGLKTLYKQAFYKVTALTDARLPDGVATIGESSFQGCSGLSDLRLPNSVETIGANAFKDCTALARVENFLPGSLTAMDSTAWSGVKVSELKKAVWPAGLQDVPDEMFKGWEGLEEIEFREGLVSIGREAFSLCTGLKRFTNPFPSTLEKIGSAAFGFNGSEGQLTGCADFSRCGQLREIPDGCFWNCKHLEEVILPPCLTNVGQRGFYNLTVCTNIGVVAVTGRGLEFMRTADGYLAPYAFQGCKGVKRIDIPWGGKTVFQAGDTHGCFGQTPQLEEIRFFGRAPDADCPDFLYNAGTAWTTRLVVSKKIDQAGWMALSDGKDYKKSGCFGACTKPSGSGIYMYWGKSPLEVQPGLMLIFR